MARLLNLSPCLLVILSVTSVENSVVPPGREDESRVISIVAAGDKFEVLEGYQLFDSVVVWANFTNDQKNNGWMYLEISSNQDFPDEVQAKAAGFAEGYLTRNSIYEYYKEFFTNDVCKGEDGLKVCQYMKDQIKVNDDWIKESVQQKAKNDSFWHMINLFYQQMEGITEGWINKTLKQEAELPPDFDLVSGIKLINYIADMFDYMEKYNLEAKEVIANNVTRPTCSALIKHLPDQADLYVSHNTWHEYRAMGYRFLKKYQLNYHVLPGSKEIVPGHTATMSSFSGTILSLDDFVTLSSGLVTTETSLFVYNSSLFGASDPRAQVFEPARVMAANRIARNGKEWTDTVSLYNSGTYNNQWMVINYNNIRKDGTLQDGALWVLEQLPGQVWAEDQTQVLREKGYWASYNRAFYPEAFKISGAQEKVDKYGSWFSYSETPRAKIMARDEGKVVDEESMIKLMRYNSFQTDPLAQVPGCSKPIPAGSIANRCDLTLPGSKCEWEEFDYMVGHQAYGALDMKFVSKKLIKSQQFYAIAGPTHGPDMPPFSWLDTNLTNIPDYTPIQVFDFQPIVHAWTMQGINDAIKTIL
eukprot:GFUD01132790.1.p1 GENE.GFUD01132790.1~~GFUD01132790.1.p1  ORF type:complete len:586 (+),score=132.83 GFUD01132790.1:1-1758(+)